MPNLYDRMFDQLCAAGADPGCAVETVVEAYLDGKPATRGKHRCSRHARDTDFWLSRLVARLPVEAWSCERLTLALSRYLGQALVANPALLKSIADASPATVTRAVRWSGLVLQRHSPRRAELDCIAVSNADIAEFCRILDIFDQAFRERLALVEDARGALDSLSPFELLIYASLYAFEHLVPRSFVTDAIPGIIPKSTLEESQAHWDAINDLLIWKLGTAPSARLRLREQDLGLSLKNHLSPFLFPSPLGAPPRHDLRAAFAAALAAQLELNSFRSQSADAFSFDDGIAFVRHGKALEIVATDPAASLAWARDGRKLERLRGYWFYRAIDEFIALGLGEQTIGRPENQEANRLAYISAIRTRLRLTEVYGVDDRVTTSGGQCVDLFRALLASELMNIFYQQEFLQAFVSHAERLGHWAAALGMLAMEGLADGMQNRFPLSWSDRKARINRILGWTVCDEHPRGNHAMAAAILDFWTSDWVALAERLRKGEPGIEPELLERPILKIGQQLIELPWVFGLQDNGTAAINNLRRLGARREDARLETRRIEERLGALFEIRGFRVVLNWVAEDDPRSGEVDLICALERCVLVLELKSTFIRESPRDAWLHRTTTLRKAGRQLLLKVPAVRRALTRGAGLAQDLGVQGPGDALDVRGWIVDTSIECDHQRFSGYLKISLEEVLIALRDDRHLLDDPDGLFSGRWLQAEFAAPAEPPRPATLYPAGFSASALVRVIEGAAVWDEV